MRAYVGFAGAVLFCFSSARANLLANGDFETRPFLSGWTVTNSTNPVGEDAGLVPGSEIAAYITTNGLNTAGFYQSISETPSEWQFDTLFATQNWGNRNLSIYLNGVGRDQIQLNVDTTHHLLSVSTHLFGAAQLINYSTDANNNNTFSDPGDTLVWYALRVVGHYGVNPTYDVMLSDPDSTNLTHVQTGLSIWSGGFAPTAGDGLTMVRFDSIGGEAVIDNVSLISLVPEPASLAMLAMALPMTLRRSRR